MLIIGHRRCQPASVVGGASDHALQITPLLSPIRSDHHSLLSRLPTPFLKNRSTPFFKPLMPPPLQPLEASDWTLVFVTSAAWNWTMLWDVLDQLYSD
jgi:hypothetical protein